MIATDQLMSAVTGVAIALLSTPWLARLGVWGIERWLEQGLSDELRKVEPIWWAATIVLAFSMAVGVEFRAQFSTAIVIFASIIVGLGAALLTQLARIDARCRLLPDSLTFGLLTSGLVFHAVLAPGDLVHAIIGAVLGYGLLWSLALTFRKIRNAEAMGRGDFAMAAGIGAWLGWQGLPFALMLSCLFALGFAGLKNVFKDKPSSQSQAFLSQELAFGPALSAGTAFAWIALG